MRTVLLEEQASEGKEGISCAVRKTAKEDNESFVCSRDETRLAGGGGGSGGERGERDAFLGGGGGWWWWERERGCWQEVG